MEEWLKKAIDLIKKSFKNIKDIDYKIIIRIFYEHLSNRNLAKLISILYDLNEIDVYFEIDIIIFKEKFDESLLENTLKVLKENGFDKWVEEE